MKLLIFFCLSFLILITGCELDQKRLAEFQKQAIADSLQKHKADSIRQYSIKRIKEIKNRNEYPDFAFQYDYITEKGDYFVKTKVNPDKLPHGHLWLRILADGKLLFSSVYYGKHRIYHTKIQAKIGNSLITSLEVPIGSGKNIVEAEYVETVWFTETDNGNS